MQESVLLLTTIFINNVYFDVKIVLLCMIFMQDPDNPAASVIVIRSLVPDGVAEQDGRLIPGDRLVLVNESNLENCTLDAAVQVLKGAPRGMVTIGVAKPAAGMESEEVCQNSVFALGPVSQNLSSLTNDSLYYKLVKSLLLIGYRQICHLFLSFVIAKRLCETGPRFVSHLFNPLPHAYGTNSLHFSEK